MGRRMARWVVVGLWVSLSLLAATVAVAALEAWSGVSNASIVYLVAVVACGVAVGTMGAILASVGSFLIYNYFFVPPLYTFTIGEPDGLLSLVLLLFVGIVVGQLAALQRARAETAAAREREARALFGVSRVLATRASTREALDPDRGGPARGGRRSSACGSRSVRTPPGSRSSRTRPRPPVPPTPRRQRVLQRMPGDEPARWVVVHRPGAGTRAPAPVDTYRVRIEASGDVLGSIWAERDRDAGEPDQTQTRLLAAAADQIGQALARDRIAEEAQAAEVARRARRRSSPRCSSRSRTTSGRRWR